MAGARIATTTRATTNAPARSAPRCRRNRRQNSRHGVRTAAAPGATSESAGVPTVSLIADEGVQRAVEHVDDQVDHDELEREEEHLGLDDRVVVHLHRVDE